MAIDTIRVEAAAGRRSWVVEYLVVDKFKQPAALVELSKPGALPVADKFSPANP